MNRTRIGARLISTLCLLLVCAATVASAADDRPQASDSATTHTHLSDADWIALFDQHTPLVDRQRALATIEQSPNLDDPQTLYMLGSIYHMGKDAPGAPVDADPAKAVVYLGNAAIHGSVLAMAKMAEIKLAAGQYREAMNWAQIYAHYAPIAKQSGKIEDSYLAELIHRIKDGLDASAMDGIMKDVRGFVFVYDTSIRTGIDGERLTNHLDMHSRTHYFQPVINHERYVTAGMADYLLAFGPDGTVINAQPVDSEPLPSVAITLLPSARQMTTDKSSGHALRYAWVPMLLGDMEYHLKDRH
ncbi:MAG TPA: hypothetical protein VL997_14660 [Dyella sp.]|nr:hypothetical protein [Dyella sp.]